MSFLKILEKYRKISFSERDKGDRFERLIQAYLKTTKKSQIKNNPNDWAKEVGNPRYILDLLLSIINVSVQTVDIVNSLPKVKF